MDGACGDSLLAVEETLILCGLAGGFDRLAELHMSQIELSRRTSIATSTISDWRKKKINPQVDKLVAICKALDVSLVDLLCDGDQKEKKGVQTDFMLDERHIVEVFRMSDNKTKKRLLRYFELVEICNQINENNVSKKMREMYLLFKILMVIISL